MNLPVPDPILLTNSHDGLDGVRFLSWPRSPLLIIKTAWPALRGVRTFLFNNGPWPSRRLLGTGLWSLGGLPEVKLYFPVLRHF